MGAWLFFVEFMSDDDKIGLDGFPEVRIFFDKLFKCFIDGESLYLE